MILLNRGKASRGVCACSFNIALAQRPHCPHWLAISNSFRKSRIDVAPFSMAVLICLSVTCLQIHTYMALGRCVVSISRKLSKPQIRMIINKSIGCILLTLEAGPPSPAAINHTDEVVFYPCNKKAEGYAGSIKVMTLQAHHCFARHYPQQNC